MRKPHIKTGIARLFVVWSVMSFTLQAQDLDVLLERAEGYLDAMRTGSLLNASNFVLPEDRERFVRDDFFAVRSAAIRSLTFTDSPDVVVVTAGIVTSVPNFGDVQRTVENRWEWMEDTWFLSYPAAASPFGMDSTEAGPEVDPVPEPAFEIATDALDLGRQPQGAIVEGRLEFRGDRSRIRSIIPPSESKLGWQPPEWLDDETGVIAFSWDTALESQDYEETWPFTAMGPAGTSVERTIRVRMAVDGKVRFEQDPDPIDLRTPGRGTLAVTNISDAAVRLVTARSRGVQLDDLELGIIEAGSTELVTFSYREPADSASLMLSFDAELSAPLATVSVPLNVVEPDNDASRPAYSREELERILRNNGLVQP